MSGRTGWIFTRGQSCSKSPGGDCSTKWRSSVIVPRRKWGAHSSSRRAAALGLGAMKFGRGCRGYGCATHTNTDNVPPVRQ